MSHSPNGRESRRPRPYITDKQLRAMIFASNLPSKERHTLLTLADGLDRYLMVITMGRERLASALALRPRAAIKRLRALEATGVIVPLRTGGGRAENGRGYVNTWGLALERLIVEEKDATEHAGKGAVEPPHGRTRAAGRAQLTTQDQPLQSSQKKNSSGSPPAAPGSSGLPLGDPDAVRPWINPHAPEHVRVEQRRRHLRATLAHRASKRDDASSKRPEDRP